MNKIKSILVQEILNLVSRFSFWFGAVGVPLIGFTIYAGVSLVNNSQDGDQNVASTLIQSLATAPEELPVGYIDRAGLIQVFPPDVDEAGFIAFPDEKSALVALEEFEILGYITIAEDYINTGEMVFTADQFSLETVEVPNILERVIQYNLLGQDLQRYDWIIASPQVKEVSLSPAPARDQDNALTFFLPYAVTLLFYILIMGSATLMLNSIGKEKENRIIEILMVSVSPTQLLSGKMIGLGLVGLFQLVIWGGSAYSLLWLSGRAFNLPPEFQLAPSILAWGVVFFILGYILYGCLMSGLGALVPNIREASQVSFIIVLPMLIPLITISVLIRAPNGGLAVGLSLFPLTSPVTMMLRLAATSVPVWQILLSIFILLGAVFLAIRAAAGMFRAQTLLSGQKFSLKTFLLALAGR
jgi:ABC-2 type transport system permease protein